MRCQMSNTVSLLSNEHEVSHNLYYDDTVDDFIHARNRKKTIFTATHTSSNAYK